MYTHKYTHVQKQTQLYLLVLRLDNTGDHNQHTREKNRQAATKSKPKSNSDEKLAVGTTSGTTIGNAKRVIVREKATVVDVSVITADACGDVESSKPTEEKDKVVFNQLFVSFNLRLFCLLDMSISPCQSAEGY